MTKIFIWESDDISIVTVSGIDPSVNSIFYKIIKDNFSREFFSFSHDKTPMRRNIEYHII